MQVQLNNSPGWSSRVKKMWEKSRACILVALFMLIVTVGLGFCTKSSQQEQHLLKGNSSVNNESDFGEPLLLTPLIKRGELEKAKSLSEVHYFKKLGNVTSYSGYFTTNSTFNTNLFFWFFPAQKNPKTAPLLLWLQGGPGQPSTIGLFAENGPMYVTNNGESLHFRTITWTKVFNMLYIDSPAGSGCSFTHPSGYATSHGEVTDNLYEALNQFFKIFSEYRANEFYISGESYAGKYAPNLGKWIHEMNAAGKNPNINFKGLAIGNGFVDPVRMIHNTSDYLYNLGFLDETGRDYFRAEEAKAVKLIQDNRLKEANDIINVLIHVDSSKYEEQTGLRQYYNILKTQEAPYFQHLNFLKLSAIRKAIHVGHITCVYEFVVYHNLANDIFLTAKPAFEFLLDQGYKILLYNGNLDIIVSIPATVNFINSLQWKHVDKYKTTPRIIWTVNNGTVAGYVKSVDNFSFVIVRNAGHMAIMDQPEYCFDMIVRFIFGKKFH